MRTSFFAAAFVLAGIGTTGIVMAKTMAPAASPALKAAVAAPSRTPANIARDKYRNPVATLQFFGVKPTNNVVEIWPGGGWYTEILSPYLSANGKLTVAVPGERQRESISKKLTADPATYGKVQIATFPMTPSGTQVAAGRADVVLTFRNVHNWRFGGVDKVQVAFNEMFAMLKPGGTLGVVEHRLPESMETALEEKSGYMKRSSVIAYATRAGFKLAAESQINANPRDTHDYPKGVWTLPPNYAEGDVDRAKYAAIGESDRMTLKFVKPMK
jgi:predicted methyltransferase